MPGNSSGPVVTSVVNNPARALDKKFFCSFSTERPIRPSEFVQRIPTHPFLDGLANSDRSYIVAAPTGAGKSLTLRAALCRALVYGGESTIMVADPKAEQWSGLEKFPSVVHYLTESMGDKLDLDWEVLEKMPIGIQEDYMEISYWAWCIKQAWNELQRRIKTSTPMRRRGMAPPTFHPWVLVLDEHFSCLAKYEKMSSKAKDALQVNAVMSWLSDIVTKGRALGVRCVLISQSHLTSELGFSSAIRRSFGVLVLGRIDPLTGMGDLSMISAAISDRYLIPSDQARDALKSLFSYVQGTKLVKRGYPIALNVTGVNPKLGILPNLTVVDKIATGDAYLGFHPEIANDILSFSDGLSKSEESNSLESDGAKEAISEVLRVARHFREREREKKEVITASDVRNYSAKANPVKHMPLNGIRELFREIVQKKEEFLGEGGKAFLLGDGSSLSLKIEG